MTTAARRTPWYRFALASLLTLLCWPLHTPLAAAAEREVRVGVYSNEPKISMGAQQQPTGILGDLLIEIAHREAWTLQTVDCTWQECLNALQAGDIDLMPDVAYTEARGKTLAFHTTPALLSWSQLYKHRSVRLDSAVDLQDKRIAVLDGSVQQEYLTNLAQSFGLHTEFIPVSSLREAFEKVRSGGADAAAANRFYGDLQATSYQLEPTPILFQPTQLFFATAKGRNADLLSAIDGHLKPWQAEPGSPYFLVLQRWMNTRPDGGIPAYVWWSVAGLAALFLLTLGKVFLLNREVTSKTWDLRSVEDRLTTILNSVDAYIYIKDTALRYKYVNRKVSDLFGMRAQDVVGKMDRDFFDPETSAKLRINDLRVVEQGERVEEEEANRSVDGTFTHTYLSVKLPLKRPDGTVYALCGISTDITKHKLAEEAIHRLAFYDPLTGLPNRRLLMDRLSQTLAMHARDKACGALLFIDVDNFKDLNDTLGHPMGDQLLRQIAHRLSACTRAQDTLARQGGDEFVVMLQGLHPELAQALQQTQTVAEKILASLAEPYLLEHHHYQTSVSIGITLFSGHATGQDELLQQADLAMYQAKSDGRNAVRFFNPQMQEHVNARMALEADLHQALALSQFVLHYQPQMSHAGHQLGVEALVRWRHPQRGLVSPAEFIPIAEASGLILPLGEWILREACRQLVTWSTDPHRAQYRMAVNVSARQFRQPDFVQQIESALKETGANPHLLELELTESQLVDNIDNVIAKMSALKSLGVRFSLDDFGTGYSSLSILKTLPLDQLKIDQSFVRDVLNDPQDASIVRTIVTLGDSLGLQVIAEGVETADVRDALVTLGCTRFQGYYFGRPLPA